MKRNLSSYAIKAMAIGMAVALGSSTAISGVVGGTVVEAFASATIQLTNPGVFSSIANENKIVSNNGYVFEIVDAGQAATNPTSNSSDGTVALIGKITDGATIKGEGNGTTIPYVGTFNSGAGTVAITAGAATHTMNIVQVGKTAPLTSYKAGTESGDQGIAEDNTTTVTIASTDLITTNVTEIKENALAGVTVTGDLDLTSKTVANTAFSNDTKGVQMTGKLTLPTGFTGAANSFKNATIGEVALPSSYTGVANLFADATITTLTLPADYTGAANDFDNANITTLDASAVSAKLANSTFASATIDTLTLPAGYTGADQAFNGATITTLDLTDVTGEIVTGTFASANIGTLTHNGTAIMGASGNGATITTLNFKPDIAEIKANAFQNATIPATVTVPESVVTGTGIGANAFDIKNNSATTIKLEGYAKAHESKINASAFGTTNANITVELPQGTSEDDRAALETILKRQNSSLTVTIAGGQETGNPAITADNPKYSTDGTNHKITFTVDKALKTQTITGKDGFTITGDTVNPTVKSIDVKDKTVTLTLDKALNKGKNYTLKFDNTSTVIKDTDDSKKLENFNKPIDVEVPPVYDELVATTSEGTYTFKIIDNTSVSKGVMLVDYNKNTSQRTSTNATLDKGVVTVDGTKYNLTQIGDGTNPISNIDSSALRNHSNNVTTIANNAFENNTNISDISMFTNVKTIGSRAFRGATQITNVSLNSVETVGSSAFENATRLRTVSLPYVTSVSSKAFANTSVETANLGKSVNNNYAVNTASDIFAGVTTLRSIETNGNSVSKNNMKDAAIASNSDSVDVISGGNTDTVKPDNSGSSSSGGGSGSSGGGASIGNAGTSTDSNNNNNNSGNNNNGGTVVVEDKELTLDVINLPSVTGEPKVFADVSANHWAKAHIDKLSTAGIINGANGMFNPNGQTKRADVTIMLVNLLGLTPETNNKFADVNPAAYYAPYVGTASTYGIVNGSNGMFNPEGIISRQDTMVMIAQILKSLDLNVNTDTTALSKFSDADKVSSYANESVAILINSGIISGNNGKLNPTAPVTRAEMATIMSKLYDVLDAAK